MVLRSSKRKTRPASKLTLSTGKIIMAGNTAPIYSKAGALSWSSSITAANTSKDGISATDLVFTADAINGSYIHKLKIRPKGTNVSTVLRVFINNGLTNATAANNTLYDELTLTNTTVSEVAAVVGYEIPMGFILPAGYRIYATLGTAVAGGYAVTAVGGAY
jgi:hypothetical protein